MSEALDAAREALRDTPAWVVGGAVRDQLLGRPVDDVDIAVEGDPRSLARRLAVAVGGPAFPLSEAFGAWRVIGPERRWQVDVCALQGDTIEADLARRDFTINAIAEPLAGGPLLDPHAGGEDLRRRTLRMVSEAAFDADPLRVLRLARFACELGLAIDPPTRDAARARAARIADVSPERIFAELKRLVAAPDAVDGMRLLDELGLTAHLLPEVHALHGVEQNRFHHLDVHGHTLEVLARTADLERDPGGVLGDAALGEQVAAVLAEPLADQMTRAGGLRWAALLHDVAKPQTRTELPGGRVGFPRHDELGAAAARAILGRLRASDRLQSHVAGLTRHHLRLGFLVHEAPLGRRAVHRYLTACDPVAADVTLLTVADRLATRGDNAEPAIQAHLELARPVLAAALEDRPVPLVRGDELARELGIAPGPRLGQLLAELAEAQFAREIATREEAISHARDHLDR